LVPSLRGRSEKESFGNINAAFTVLCALGRVDTIIIRATYTIILALLACAVPAFASASPSVIVNSPTASATVPTPFILDATTTPCSGQPVAAIGYSLDDGATTIVNAISINAEVSASLGAHTLHVESWGIAGAGCDTNVSITVSAAAAAALFTNLTVSQPAANAELVSPFTLIASGTQCESQPIAAIGFSIDDSTTTSVVYGVAVNASVTSATGVHTLHVKSWGNQGAGCDTDIAIDVVPSPISTLPANAIEVQSIQTMANWQAAFDTATGANASTFGVSSLTSAPSLSSASREFVSTFAGIGGERYAVSFGVDTSATNFLYDTWVYIPSSSTDIANLEFDLNQVMANGDTVIFGFQCDSWSNTWDYTANAGTPKVPSDVWLHSKFPCNVPSWTTDTWHHVQISYSHDSLGNATYQSVWLDNVEQDLNITVPDAFSLGWSPTLLTNFQVDSMTSVGAADTVYLDKLTVWRYIVDPDNGTGSPVAATLTMPAPSSKLSGPSVTFTWSAGEGVTDYWFNVGTTDSGSGSKNIYSGSSTTLTSATASGLPSNGATLYATLYSFIAGAWQPTVYTYTASGSPTTAVLATPGPGSALTSSAVTFTWSAGNPATYYWFNLGTGASGAAAKNIYSGSSTRATSVTVTGLPTSGETIYATLYSYIGGTWQPTVYTYK